MTREIYILVKNKLLKSIILVVILCFFAVCVSAQTDSLPVYKQFPTVPPLKLRVLPDSSVFVRQNLKKKKKLIIMIFSPDCDHCIHTVEALIKDIDQVKDYQLLMVTSLPYPMVQSFYNRFKLGEYKNITVGVDNAYFLGTFFNVKSFPSLYIYDKKGRLKKEFIGTVDWKSVSEVK